MVGAVSMDGEVAVGQAADVGRGGGPDAAGHVRGRGHRGAAVGQMHRHGLAVLDARGRAGHHEGAPVIFLGGQR